MGNDEDRLVGMTEASRYLDVSVLTLKRYIDNGVLPAQRTLGGGKRPGHRRVRESVLKQARELMQEGHDAEAVKAWFALNREAANG